MKKLHLILALILLCLAIVPAQAQTNPTSSVKPPRVLTESENQEIKQLNDRIVSLYQEGKYNEVVTTSETLRQRITALLGQDSVSLITVYKNLGEAQMELKIFGEAISSFRQALKIQEKSGADALVVAVTLLRLGFAAFKDGQMDTAAKSFTRAVAIREQKLPPDSPLLADALVSLAQSHIATKHLDKAEPLIRRALNIKEDMAQAPADLTWLEMRYECLLIKLNRLSEYDALLAKQHREEKERAANDPTRESGVINGKAIDLPRPVYPEEAKRNRVQGQTSVKVLIDKEGRVIHACAISGHPLLQESSEAAAYRARFTPTLLEGKPVTVTGVINYNFVAR